MCAYILAIRPELDTCESPDKYPQLFHVLLDIEVEGTEKQKDLTPPWEQFPTRDLSPNVLFSSHQEHQQALAIAGQLYQHLNTCHTTVVLFTLYMTKCCVTMLQNLEKNL